MFGLFRKKRSVETEQARPVQTPTDMISYNENFISELLSDHGELMRIFYAIKESAERDDSKGAIKLIQKFTRLLRGHLLKENIRLYVYLQQLFENDPESEEIVKQYKREMQGIGLKLNKFFTKYSTMSVEDFDKVEFAAELEHIGEILFDRLENEEKALYPLYAPPNSYQRHR